MADETSILDTIKQSLGVAAEYTPFDTEILMHINSVFSDLRQLGVGPAAGFSISDSEPKWTDYLQDNNLISNVKSYMHLRVKLLFDGPEARYTIQAIKDQIAQFEWRINATMEETNWVDPMPNVQNQFVTQPDPYVP